MKYKSLLAAAVLVITVHQSFSQQRVCDMSITLVSPANGSTINADAQYTISVTILNNGPDDLLAGDTVYYNTPTVPSFTYKPYILQQGIAAGNTATVVLETAANHNTNTFDATENYCVKLRGNLNDVGSFIDTANVANNVDCNEVLFKASNPTSVQNIYNAAERLSFYPNPSNGDISINFESHVKQDVAIYVRDVTGKVISQQSLKNVAASKNTFSVHLGNLAKGLYILELRTADRKASGKLVIQ